jgi:hypothetical protein
VYLGAPGLLGVRVEQGGTSGLAIPSRSGGIPRHYPVQDPLAAPELTPRIERHRDAQGAQRPSNRSMMKQEQSLSQQGHTDTGQEERQ